MRPTQVTMGSQPQKKTIPLPLEINYLPSGQTVRARITVRETEGERISHWSLRPGDTPIKVATPEDPWQLRDEFLSLTLTGEGLGQARSRFGFIWLGVFAQFVNPDQELTDDAVDELFLDELREWQSLLRAALTTKKDRWPELTAKFSPVKVDLLCQPLSLVVDWREGLPAAVIHCDSPLKALIATVWIDALLGTEHHFCACRGCTKPQPFKVKRRNQIYCDDDCKHLQVVRNGRRRKRDAELLAKQSENLREDK
jgi:hypothetical protein